MGLLLVDYGGHTKPLQPLLLMGPGIVSLGWMVQMTNAGVELGSETVVVVSPPSNRDHLSSKLDDDCQEEDASEGWTLSRGAL